MSDDKQTLTNTSIHELILQGVKVHILDRRLGLRQQLEVELTLTNPHGNTQKAKRELEREDWNKVAAPQFQFIKIGPGMSFALSPDGMRQIAN